MNETLMVPDLFRYLRSQTPSSGWQACFVDARLVKEAGLAPLLDSASSVSPLAPYWQVSL